MNNEERYHIQLKRLVTMLNDLFVGRLRATEHPVLIDPYIIACLEIVLDGAPKSPACRAVAAWLNDIKETYDR